MFLSIYLKRLECEFNLISLGLRLRVRLGDPDPELGVSARARNIPIGAYLMNDESAPVFEERERDVLVFEPLSEDPPSYHQVWEQG